MAQEPTKVILIPELDKDGKGQFQLELSTHKGGDGRIISAAHGQYVREGMVTFELCGDFSKRYAANAGRATQKTLDAQQAAIFGPDFLPAILAEVKAFYDAKAKKAEGD